ncbi:hypothetical protein PN498_27160 [Oscillatoria sp. CS-180]|uniref:hypothetical protein n=1 Tax=Oscillatoria sp. CS-180 TaxID=3021720 RepID=UPI0023305294|nr:hypothetical protein [Oscillatoria sp. CS-180]MDB9529697.1 hypothetical protein [Oscillatoria sp. CS-180]
MLRKSTQCLLAGGISLVVAVASTMPGMAQLRDQYTLQQAESGAVSIQVWPGSGTNLDFTSTGQYIYRAWLDDPSRVQLDTDTPIENANAQIIHLRKIASIDFEGLPSTGVTLLSVATVDATGQRHLYQFRVTYGDHQPEYATISLTPQAVSPQIDTLLTNSADGGVDLETFRAGITQLILDGTIAGDGPMHERLKAFMGLVQSGSSPAVAAQSAGVDLAVVQEVAQIGLDAAAAGERSRFIEEEEPSDVDGEIEATDEDAAVKEAVTPTETIDSGALIETLRRMSTLGGE